MTTKATAPAIDDDEETPAEAAKRTRREGKRLAADRAGGGLRPATVPLRALVSGAIPTTCTANIPGLSERLRCPGGHPVVTGDANVGDYHLGYEGHFFEHADFWLEVEDTGDIVTLEDFQFRFPPLFETIRSAKAYLKNEDGVVEVLLENVAVVEAEIARKAEARPGHEKAIADAEVRLAKEFSGKSDAYKAAVMAGRPAAQRRAPVAEADLSFEDRLRAWFEDRGRSPSMAGVSAAANALHIADPTRTFESCITEAVDADAAVRGNVIYEIRADGSRGPAERY